MPSGVAVVKLVSLQSPLDWFMIAVCVVMALASPSLLSSVWSGRHKWVKMHDPPDWWYWGGPLWRGWVRILPCSPFFMISCTAAVLVGAFSTKGSVGMWVVIALGLPAFVIGLVIYPAVVLFARPRSAVPPSLRGQRGALAEWREQWARPGRP